jgi:hypothetical protein
LLSGKPTLCRTTRLAQQPSVVSPQVMKMTEAKVARCGQCGRPAVVEGKVVQLCVECHYKLQVANTLALRLAAIGMNYAAAEMDHVTGLRNFTPRMQVPDIPKGPIILNNIKVDNSVVGSINTGSVQTVDVSITYLKNAGNDKVGNALKALTEAIANEASVSKKDKDDMLDQVAYLSEQASSAANDRKPGMIKATFGALTQAAATVSAIASAWSAAEPLLKGHFGIG